MISVKVASVGFALISSLSLLAACGGGVVISEQTLSSEPSIDDAPTSKLAPTEPHSTEA